MSDDSSFRADGDGTGDGSGHGVARIDTDGALVSYLYRVEESDGYFYSTVREVQAKMDVELIGVATRYSGDQFRSAESPEEFRENLNRLAVDVYWFDEPVPTDGKIAELLYRTSWGDDRYLYAATRSEVEFTSHDIIGVVVRPPLATVESTKWGRDDFEENVAEVSETTVWFTEKDRSDP